jgi:hypothetical protein
MTLSPRLGRVLGVAGAAAVTFGVAALSQAPYRPYPDEEAMLRLAWSARPERIETCRRQTEEELAKWPPHMRQLVVCEGTTARYQLEVRRDGALLLVDTVRGGGARHDRPLYVLREEQLSPGAMRLEVRFTRIDHPSPDTVLTELEPEGAARIRRDQERREAQERERRREEAIPPVLVLDSIVRLEPRTVLLVTYDRSRGTLVARTGARDS